MLKAEIHYQMHHPKARVIADSKCARITISSFAKAPLRPEKVKMLSTLMASHHNPGSTQTTWKLSNRYIAVTRLEIQILRQSCHILVKLRQIRIIRAHLKLNRWIELMPELQILRVEIQISFIITIDRLTRENNASHFINVYLRYSKKARKIIKKSRDKSMIEIMASAPGRIKPDLIMVS